MNLWIRSQHKANLCKITSLEIEKNKEGYDIWNYNHDHPVYLGTYKTKERALEVLDEIQDLLVPKMVVKNEGNTIYGSDGNVYTTNISGATDIQELSTCVYQMPEE